MFPVLGEAMPTEENFRSLSHSPEKLRTIAERSPAIANDLRHMADNLDATTRGPTAYRERPAKAAVRQRLDGVSRRLRLRL
jgi:hypothetical protein